jgi:hypothetical protein
MGGDDSVFVNRIPHRADQLPPRRATDGTDGSSVDNLDVFEPEFVSAVATAPPRGRVKTTGPVGQPDRVDFGMPLTGFRQK